MLGKVICVLAKQKEALLVWLRQQEIENTDLLLGRTHGGSHGRDITRLLTRPRRAIGEDTKSADAASEVSVV